MMNNNKGLRELKRGARSGVRHPERDDAIVRAINNGDEVRDVAREFGLSPARVYQIYQKAFLAQREGDDNG